MLPHECAEQFGMFQSPVGQTSNRLLWGDWDKGEYGVIIRSLDIFDRPGEHEKVLKEVFEYEESPDPLQHLPAAYVHASLRAPKAMFVESLDSAVGVLVGTKYKKNWAMASYQRKDAIDCASYYPTDAGTMSRGVLGGAADKCVPGRTIPLCVDNECLANEESACGGCSVAPDKMGDLVGRFFENENRTDGGLTYNMCDYPDVEDMVVASNGVYKERKRWFEVISNMEKEYAGHTECLASLNIKSHDMTDALVVPLYDFGVETEHSLCEYVFHVEIDLGLQLAWNHSYGDLPILFYHESLGMRKNEDCIRYWGGRDCNEGWQKEFFSQEYQFDSNACIHRPPGCQEAYYFPPDGDECSAFTRAGEDRIKELCAQETRMDAVLAAKMQERASLSLRAGIITVMNGPPPGAKLPPSYDFLYHGCFLVVCVILSMLVRGRIVVSVSKD